MHTLIKLKIIENPWAYLRPIEITFDDIDSIWEIVIDLLLREPYILWVIRESLHIMLELFLIILKKLIFILLHFIMQIIVHSERSQDQVYN